MTTRYSINAVLIILLLSLSLLGGNGCAFGRDKTSSERKKAMWLREVIEPSDTEDAAKLPISFVYGGVRSSELLSDWRLVSKDISSDKDGAKRRITVRFADMKTGLGVTFESIEYKDFPAIEWVLYFENTGEKDTLIIEDIQALDIELDSPMSEERPFVLHRTNGAPSNPTDFEMREVVLKGSDIEVMGGGGGRSSNRDFPFFRIDTGRGSVIIAVGWSGQWKAQIQCIDNEKLHVVAGMELTRFKLRPGEKVRSPRILALSHEGEPVESNSQFRRLIQKHYVAPYKGERHGPILYCNTCFTRGGGWLNECNEENQISLIKALEPLGVEAVITDAGWFEGGWPSGAGNWTPRKDAYPNGMAPVAAAAKENGMMYGLWFEPERVVAGTRVAREHPEWLLWRKGDKRTALLNFGLPEVQEYFFNIVDGFMKLPGFGAYRQDFNMDPLQHWRDNDAPDRQGINEMKYIEGLYAYWDRIIEKYPESFRVECSSGGRRIDLETVMRMHVHQKSDHWFDNTTDQASLMGLSQYLPNGVVMAPINRLDDYSFHSAMASSLCLGWIADGPEFDMDRAKELTKTYQNVRHLLRGDWYPLTGYSRDAAKWIGSQYHRPDLDEGMVLIFRRERSPYVSMQVKLRGLEEKAAYSLTAQSAGWTKRASGADLMKGFEITLDEAPSSELIVYTRCE